MVFLESRSDEFGRMIKKINLDTMSIDEMWRLHEKIAEVLSARLLSEKRELEKRLTKLRGETRRQQESSQVELSDDQPTVVLRERRKFPRLSPKYQNPSEPFETWSGRGKQPRWLTAALMTGRKLEEFAIKPGEANNNNRQSP